MVQETTRMDPWLRRRRLCGLLLIDDPLQLGWSIDIASIISSSDCTRLVVEGNGGDSNSIGDGFMFTDLMPTITSSLKRQSCCLVLTFCRSATIMVS
jgi:hypothetical protein